MIKDEIMVSVMMTAYNHGPYVLQALEGVAKQITNFNVQLIIHDDASPDNTADLIRDFVAKHQEMDIETIFQTENQYSQKVRISDVFLYPLVRGKYVIVCEGDDYWTDEYKLQKQVDFLEAHPEYIGVSHNCVFVDENSNRIKPVYQIYGPYREHTCTLSTLSHGFYPGQTATLMLRTREYYDVRNEHLDEWYKIRENEDKRKALELLLNGNIYFMDDFMSAYRVVLTKGTSWSARQHNHNRYYSQFLGSIDCRKYSKKVYKRSFKNYHVTLKFIYYSFLKKRSGNQEDVEAFNKIAAYCGGKFKLLLYSAFLAMWGLPGYIGGKLEYKRIFKPEEA